MRRARRMLTVTTLALGLGGCGSDPPAPVHVDGTLWPTLGTAGPEGLSSSFGPRIQKSKDRYDFHRGIDIPAPVGATLYAIADGDVTRAGDDPGFSDKVLQVEHCADGHCYYSTYLHLGDALVEVGDHVTRGQIVALSGLAESGFPTLHFEIRDERPEQDHCVHPLHFLPSPTDAPITLTLGPVEDADPAQVAVEVLVSQPRRAPDLLEVSISTTDRATGAAIEERVFNVDDWNRKYSPKDNPTIIDDPDLEDLHIEPAEFTETSPTYDIRFRFIGLTPAGEPGDLAVTARARGVHSAEVEVSSP